MSLSRTLYSDQSVSIQGIGSLPVKSVSLERSRPVENVLALGKKGAISRQLKEIEKFTVNIKAFLPKTGGVTASNVSQLIRRAELGNPTSIELNGKSNNFSAKGILTKFALDASIGDFPTVDFSFEGLGAPGAGGGFTATKEVGVCDSSNVSVGGGTVRTAKFSLDLPTEMLTTFGASLVLTNAAITNQQYQLLTKLPLKYSLTIEGENVSAGASSLTIGPCTVSITDGELQSNNINQNAGDLGAMQSFTIEGTKGTPGN